MTGRFYLFVRYMFAKQPVRILCGTDLTSMGCYANNVTVASAHSVFKNFDGALVRPAAFAVSALESDYRYNLYMLSHRILSIRPRASIFRGAFFSLMLSSPSLWYQHSSRLVFYLNFVIANYDLRILRFYGEYFLKVYNY